MFYPSEQYYETPRTSKYWVSKPNVMYCESAQTSCDQHNHRCVGYVPVACAVPRCDRVAEAGWGSDNEGTYCKPGCTKCNKIICSYHWGNGDNNMCMECNGGK